MSTPMKPSGPLVSSFAHDPDMAELVQFFVSEMPARLAALNSAWEAGKVPELTRLAHQLKGASAGYGFPAIGDAAGSLEHSLKRLSGQAVAAALEPLAAEFRALVDLCARARANG